MDPRNFDAALTGALREHTWGASRPFENVTATVTVAPVSFTGDYAVDLRVRVKPRKVVVHSRYITVPSDVTDVGSRASIQTRDLYYAHGDGATISILLDALRSAVREAAPRLYEADPRIGSCDKDYPYVPLFDPPNGVTAMRRFSGCALCGQAVPDPGGLGYRAWGGGNIGWVHPTCLVGVYP